MIYLREHFGIRRELFSDLFYPADDGCVVSSVEDSRDHGVGVVIEHVSNEVHSHVTGMDEWAEPLGTSDFLDGETIEVSHDR